jgi:predicted HTH domain antitoxin
MALTISDDVLRQARLSEREARVEIACHLFDIGKLELWPAAELAGLTRVEMEGELRGRGIAIYCPTVQELRADVESLKWLGI